MIAQIEIKLLCWLLAVLTSKMTLVLRLLPVSLFSMLKTLGAKLELAVETLLSSFSVITQPKYVSFLDVYHMMNLEILLHHQCN